MLRKIHVQTCQYFQQDFFRTGERLFLRMALCFGLSQLVQNILSSQHKNINMWIYAVAGEARKAYGEVTAPLILNLGTKWIQVVSLIPRPFYCPGNSLHHTIKRGLIGPKRRSGRSGEPMHLLTLTGIKLQSLGRTCRSLAILLTMLPRLHRKKCTNQRKWSPLFLSGWSPARNVHTRQSDLRFSKWHLLRASHKFVDPILPWDALGDLCQRSVSADICRDA